MNNLIRIVSFWPKHQNHFLLTLWKAVSVGMSPEWMLRFSLHSLVSNIFISDENLQRVLAELHLEIRVNLYLKIQLFLFVFNQYF